MNTLGLIELSKRKSISNSNSNLSMSFGLLVPPIQLFCLTRGQNHLSVAKKISPQNNRHRRTRDIKKIVYSVSNRDELSLLRGICADQDQNPHPQDATFDPKQGVEGIEGLPGDDENEGKYRGLSRLGSRPPNCEHKCQGCVPCFPVQIPTTTDQIGLQYANYEPEGWKCKCGSTFFNP
ncbi:hypothetical protein Prudu_020388 [Prunus dulcis]|uniref:Epidermal patterning factor-like protein n=1 Tax=Prunus dulcis TaxID=3755 RepID=A0A4Y1RWY9_PRUDU|nr:hypothetical protein Prudu_020388 [Prunus dulcis]